MQAAQPNRDSCQWRSSLLQRHKNVSHAILVDHHVFPSFGRGNSGHIPDYAVVIDDNGSGRLDRSGSVQINAYLALRGLGAHGFEPNRRAQRRLLCKRQHRDDCQKQNNYGKFHTLNRKNWRPNTKVRFGRRAPYGWHE